MAGRFGLLFAVLLFGVSVAASPDDGDPGHHRASLHRVIAESVSAAPAFDHRQDRVRLSVGTPNASATAMPDTSWAVCSRATGGPAARGLSLAGEITGPGTTVTAPATRSSRAPPFA